MKTRNTTAKIVGAGTHPATHGVAAHEQDRGEPRPAHNGIYLRTSYCPPILFNLTICLWETSFLRPLPSIHRIVDFAVTMISKSANAAIKIRIILQHTLYRCNCMRMWYEIMLFLIPFYQRFDFPWPQEWALTSRYIHNLLIFLIHSFAFPKSPWFYRDYRT